MVAITKIEAHVQTADVTWAGTDSTVRLGIAGREFRLETAADDFRQGVAQTFIMGEESTVERGDLNDPRRPQLDTEDLNRYPVYLRYVPLGGGPDWCLERVTVTVQPGSHVFDNPVLENEAENRRIWFSPEGGEILYLRRVSITG